MGLVRKQFFIAPEQNRELKRLAAEAGISEGEFIRESLAAHIAELSEEGDWRKGLSQIGTSWVGRDDMHDFVQDLRRGWSRRLKHLGLQPDDDR